MPSTSPLFERQTPADLELEMYVDLLAAREDLLEQLEHVRDPREHAQLHERLAGIARVFGEQADSGSDPLVDEWERDLAEGRVPDLEKGLKK